MAIAENPDGYYVMDLENHEDRLMAAFLVDLAVAEPGENWGMEPERCGEGVLGLTLANTPLTAMCCVLSWRDIQRHWWLGAALVVDQGGSIVRTVNDGCHSCVCLRRVAASRVLMLCGCANVAARAP